MFFFVMLVYLMFHRVCETRWNHIFFYIHRHAFPLILNRLISLLHVINLSIVFLNWKRSSQAQYASGQDINLIGFTVYLCAVRFFFLEHILKQKLIHSR